MTAAKHFNYHPIIIPIIETARAKNVQLNVIAKAVGFNPRLFTHWRKGHLGYAPIILGCYQYLGIELWAYHNGQVKWRVGE